MAISKPCLLTDKVLRGYFDVLEEELTGRSGPDTQLVLRVGGVTPGQPRSTMKAEIPLCFADGSVLAKTRAWSATEAYEIQFFCPFRT